MCSVHSLSTMTDCEQIFANKERLCWDIAGDCNVGVIPIIIDCICSDIASSGGPAALSQLKGLLKNGYFAICSGMSTK